VPEYSLFVPTFIWTQSRNNSTNHYQRAEWIGAARKAAWAKALEAKLPVMGLVEISATPHQGRGTLADPGNHFPAVKAVIDGLRDAKVLTEDTKDYVKALTMEAPVKASSVGNTGVMLVLRPVMRTD
jgi:hypothetical protein